MRLENLDYMKLDDLVGRPDQIEIVENRQVAIAMELFRKILEDFSHHNFTPQDIKDSFNHLVSDRGRGQKYAKKHLDRLVKMGLLIYDEDNGTYSVNHNSPDVARIIEGEQ